MTPPLSFKLVLLFISVTLGYFMTTFILSCSTQQVREPLLEPQNKIDDDCEIICNPKFAMCEKICKQIMIEKE